MTLWIYEVQGEKLISRMQESEAPVGVNPIWCDMVHPNKTHETWVENWLNLQIPTRDEMHELELSNRFYHENNAIFCTISLVTQTQTPQPELHAISFILKETCLTTLRYSEPLAFKVFAQRATNIAPDFPLKANALMVGLCEAMINRLADVLEEAARNLDDDNQRLFRPAVIDKKLRQQAAPDFEELLRDIGVQADLISKISESLLSISRMLGFATGSTFMPSGSEASNRAQIVLKDIAALNDHALFLSTKIGFLLDAAVGMVGIQQNGIIKIFSVAAVVFLPPTLVASIYGMNFDFMPELHWPLGYPLALLLMVLSAIVPYLFFKKKHWL